MLAKNIVIHLYWSVDSFKRIYRVNQYFAVRELIFEFPLFYVRITIQGFDTFPMLSICLLYRWYKEITKSHKKKKQYLDIKQHTTNHLIREED